MVEHPRFQAFVARMAGLMAEKPDATRLPDGSRDAMKSLVSEDDWLPEAQSRPHAAHYQQYLLHRDPAGRFCVVSFVWGPGQKTPVHDHTVWGVIGMLRGAEISSSYAMVESRLVPGLTTRLSPGDVEGVGPESGDIHQVSNAYDDRVSVSIHCYGGDIGRLRRHVYDPSSRAVKEFVSGYADV
jgi:predicted metal-dependent enzyme (double-stranded beta helix superfamily)